MLDAQLVKESASSAVQRFSATNAASVVRNIQTARAVLRTIVLAIEATEDGSAQFEDNSGAARWNSAFAPVCDRLQSVRDELIGTANSPIVDWVTPLTLVEALCAALWHGFASDERLSNLEVVSATKVVIDLLDKLLVEFDVTFKGTDSAVH